MVIINLLVNLKVALTKDLFVSKTKITNIFKISNGVKLEQKQFNF